MNETDLFKLFMGRASYEIPALRVYRREIVNRKAKLLEPDGSWRETYLRIGIPGQGDGYALVDGGGHVEIEAKAQRGVLREAQERWQADCLARRIPHLVIRVEKNEMPNETVHRWLAELRDVVERRS